MARILKHSKLSAEKLDPAEAGPRAEMHAEAVATALATNPGPDGLETGDAAKKLLEDGAKRESD